MRNIAIIEDDKGLNNGIVLALKNEQYHFFQYYSLEEAKKARLDCGVDAIILDINLPDGNGFAYLKELRNYSDVPVIILTANDLETDEIMGLELGADDYITKPFSLMVLRARIEKVLRQNKVQRKSAYEIDDLVLDFEQMRFTKGGQEIELSKTEQKLLRMLVENREITLSRAKLVSDISHQTKTPLANILLYSQLLEEQKLDETSESLVAEIVKQSEKLDFLIQSLVKTSRLETGTFQFEPKKQELSQMLKEITKQAKQKAEKKNMQIRIQELNKDAGEYLNESENTKNNQEIRAVYDKKWTSEALYNILDNAVKYGNKNSVIEILVRAYEMFVCITISNEGTGISEEEIPCIFQRFYRGKYAGEEEGVGIGLYLSRQIVEEQGGYIKVASQRNGKTGFSVYLPKGR